MELHHKRKGSKVKNWLFRSRSKSPTPEPLSRTHTESSATQVEDRSTDNGFSTHDIDSVPPDAVSVVSKAGAGSKAAPPPTIPPKAETVKEDNPPTYSETGSELNLWEQAKNSLNEEERQLLDASVDIKSKGQELSLQDQLQDIVQQKQRTAEEKAWKFDFAGRRIVLRDLVEKIVGWINAFKSLGDFVAELDPVHAGIPWAAVKLVVQVTTAGVEQMGQVLVAVELATSLMSRGKIYQSLYLSPEHVAHSSGYALAAIKDLHKAIVLMYSKILSLLIAYIRMMDKNTLTRAFKAALEPGYFSGMMTELGRIEDRCENAANICEKNVSMSHRYLQDANYQKLRGMLEEHLKQNAANMSKFWKKLDDEERCKIFLWISEVPFETDHYNATKGRVEGTGQWLLDHSTYKTWRQAKSSTILWLNGIPGAGKTKLSSKVIDDVLGAVKEGGDSQQAFAYFYCDRNRTDHRDPVVVLRSLVRQLSAPRDESSIIPYIEAQYTERQRSGFSRDRLTSEECHDLLIQLTRDYSQSNVVIDGLDECDRDTRYVLMDTLDDIVTKATRPVKIYIASRQDQDLRDRYQTRGHLEVTANDNQSDIEKFVLNKMEQSEFCRTKMTSKIRQEVLRTFFDKSQGMFQWAALHIDELLNLKRNKDISAYLDRLPRGLEAAYHKIFGDISSQAGSKRDVAFAVFKILMCSWRPLSPEEMAIAATQVVGEDFCIDPDVDIAYVRDACHNFMVVADGLPEASAATEQQEIDDDRDAKKQKVQLMDGPSSKYRMKVVDLGSSKRTYSNAICRFSHLSVREYLELHHWSIAEANAFMACICLQTILRLQWDQEGLVLEEDIDDENDEGGFDECPVLNVKMVDKEFYRQLVWEDSDEETESSHGDDDNNDNNNEDKASQVVSGTPEFVAPPFTCFLSLESVHHHEVASVCESVEMETYLDTFRYSALERWAQYASETWSLHVRRSERHETLADVMDNILLEFLGEPRSSSRAYQAWTVFNNGKLDLTVAEPEQSGSKAQFQRGALRPVVDPVLGCASLGLNHVLSQWLADGRTDINTKSFRDDSLLVLAIKGRHIDVCESLLKQGADANRMGSSYLQPLQAAVMTGRLDFVKLLLAYGADPNLAPASLQGEGDTKKWPLGIAAARGYMEISKTLVDAGANVLKSDALSLAAGATKYEIVGFLLKKLSASGELASGLTTTNAIKPVWREAISQKAGIDVLELLSTHSLDLSAIYGLHDAAMYGNSEAIRWLLKKGMDVNEDAHSIWLRGTPLMSLIQSTQIKDEDFLEPLEVLLAAGANVNDGGSDNANATPVLAAVEHCHTEVLRRLLAAGANIGTGAESGESPLQRAIQKGYSDAVKALVDNGADVHEVYGSVANCTTPVLEAIHSNFPEILKYLLNAGATVDTQKNLGIPPLLQAIRNVNSDVVGALLMYGADANEVYDTDDGPATPIFIAAMDNRDSIDAFEKALVVKALAMSGAELIVDEMPEAVRQRIPDQDEFESYVMAAASQAVSEEGASDSGEKENSGDEDDGTGGLMEASERRKQSNRAVIRAWKKKRSKVLDGTLENEGQATTDSAEKGEEDDAVDDPVLKQAPRFYRETYLARQLAEESLRR